MSARPEHDLARSFAKMKPADRPTVEAFLQVKRAQGLKPASIANYALAMARLSAALEDPIHEAPAEAVVAYVADNVQNVWSPASESTQKILIKAFLEHTWADRALPGTFWNIFRQTRRVKAPEREPLTENEVVRLIEAASHPRDRAMIAVLWDGGFRRGEVVGLLIESVLAEEPGAWLRLPDAGTGFKTGPRTVFIQKAVPWLKEWLRNHPTPNDPEAPLFPNLQGPRKGQAPYPETAAQVLQRAAKKAGLGPHVHAHLLRHTRATEAARKNWSPSKARLFFGWARQSREWDTYAHPTEGDLREQVLNDNAAQPTYRPQPAPSPIPAAPAAPPAPADKPDLSDLLLDALADKMAEKVRARRQAGEHV